MLPHDLIVVPVRWNQGLNHAGDPVVTSITFTPSQALVHAASKLTLVSMDWVDISRGQVNLPAVDQPGFFDETGNEITDWHYLAVITYRAGSQVATVQKTFQPRTNDHVAGLDLDLVPASNPVDPPVVTIRGVSSVNGQTGDITLTAGDVDADPAGSASDALTAAKEYTDTVIEGLPAPPVTSVAGKTGAVTLSKADVGLDSVENLAPADMPISTATVTALTSKADLVAGKIPTSQIPALAVTEFLGEVSNETEMLALEGQQGDWCIRSDIGVTVIVTGLDATQLSSWTQLEYPAPPVSSVNGHVGSVVLSKADVGLGAVENIAPADMPVSTATATAIASRLPVTGGTLSGSLNLAGNPLTGLAVGMAPTDAVNLQQLDASMSQVAASGVVVMAHGSSAATPRPPVAGAVLWIGPVEPTNQAVGDIWVEVS